MRLRDRRPFIWASRGFAPSSVNVKAASVASAGPAAATAMTE